jgi:SAM-dependent methyltransferase
VGGRIIDFVGGDHSAAEAILGWPGDFLESATGALTALGRHTEVPSQILEQLVARGLADSGVELTPLGESLAYHLAEMSRQSTEEALGGFRERMSLSSRSRLLDIGCGAGQTLALFESDGLELRVGVDIDLESLAFGYRVNGWENARVVLVRASAHSLPFADQSFSHVICRVGLNYMHQATALREMARVLELGGLLYVRVEGPGFDLRLAHRARGVRSRGSRLVDFLHGATHAITGRQGVPGTRFGGGRAFGTPRRVGAILKRAGCDVISVTITARGGFGLPLGFELMARRGDAPASGARMPSASKEFVQI